MTTLRLVVLAALLAACLGCAKKQTDLPRARVEGRITLDTKPLPTGKITFEPGNGEPPAVFDILDGAYEGKAPVGKNRVSISCVTKVSMKERMGMDGPGYDTPSEQNILPARYNTQSQITRDVEASGDNKFNFDLQSK